MSEHLLEFKGAGGMEQISLNVEVWNRGEVDSIQLRYRRESYGGRLSLLSLGSISCEMVATASQA